MRTIGRATLWLIAIIGMAIILATGPVGNISGARSVDPMIEAYMCPAVTQSNVNIGGVPYDSVEFDVTATLDPFYAVNPDLWQAVVVLEIQQAALFNTRLTTEGVPQPSTFTLSSLSPGGDFYPANAFGEAYFVLTYDGATDTLHQDPGTPFEIMSVAPLDTFPQDFATYSLMAPVVFGNEWGDTVVIDSGSTVTVTGHHLIGEPIPTLTEWGIIVFCVLLVGWMAWTFVRLRRRAIVGV